MLVEIPEKLMSVNLSKPGWHDLEHVDRSGGVADAG